jgi:hypothetical protein
MHISIIAPAELQANPVSGTALGDFVNFLRQGFTHSRVTLNETSGQILIRLPRLKSTFNAVPSRFSRGRNYHLLSYPDHDYHWLSSRQNGKTVLRLSTPSFQGVSCALYGLLQEKLGYRFYHPRRTIIPEHATWPLPEVFTWEARPRFEKRGFHLHTLHPTELSEQLHDPDYPDGMVQIKEYLDWLARNQQNVLQFYLLRNIDRQCWTRHAREIVDYAHGRGILAGVNISLSMLQQQAFQAIHLLRPIPSWRHQIDSTLDWLFQVRWDFVTVELTMGEYLPDLAQHLPSVAEYLVRQMSDKYGTKVLCSTHVIRSRREIQEESLREPGDVAVSPDVSHHSFPDDTGILVHTVMCYSVTEPDAPVYGNRNQRFMLDRAKQENKRRETWYWPESSYWITFDSPVPLLLLPYLDTRWSDMNVMETSGVPGHLTFSSGWEWGYWLIDWSVARWSWNHSENGGNMEKGPLAMLHDLFPDRRMKALWRDALELQNFYLKERGLLTYMAARSPFAELPPPFNKPFQPVPDIPSSRCDMPESLKQTLHDLESYGKRMEEVSTDLEILTELLHGREYERELCLIAGELNRCLKISSLRSRHRALTLRAMSAGKERKSNGWTRDELLREAALVRQDALSLVREQESIYRYPAELLGRQRESRTAYAFGYLYPVSSLLFWEREEEQVRHNRFDALFMCIWDFRRILGLGSLF